MTPRAYVFTGPTLAQKNLVEPEGVTFMPPAAQGDVYRAAREKPFAIGIIDGYFEGQASIWHKEILYAMREGIHVFGSASMGALRASELTAFGMQGIGKIFEAYRNGEFEDDDEVAVLHAPKEAGFMPLSEPMANIRATLKEATQQGIIDTRISELLLELAKKTFYQERSWSDLFSKAAREELDSQAMASLEEWLPDHRIDQKEADALSMIETMVACIERNTPPPPASFHFEWTEGWDGVVKQSTNTPIDAGDDLSDVSVLDEVRLENGPSDPLYRLALLRYLAQSGHNPRAEPDPAKLMTAFREREGLYRRADLDSWLERQHLEPTRLEQLILDEASIEASLVELGDRLGQHLLDQLRLSGQYESVAERALAKQRHLKMIGQADPSPVDFPLSPPKLRAWYFGKRRNVPIPDDIDRYARSIGYQDRQSFDQALRRDFYFKERNQS